MIQLALCLLLSRVPAFEAARLLQQAKTRTRLVPFEFPLEVPMGFGLPLPMGLSMGEERGEPPMNVLPMPPMADFEKLMSESGDGEGVLNSLNGTGQRHMQQVSQSS